MATDISRTEVQQLVEEGGQLVDVRPEQEFEDEHIVGAIHLWLKTIDAATTAALDRNRPVIVY